MANKNVQLQSVAGDNLFPKTLGSVVFNDNNEALGGVEAGAEVNIIETVKVNGTAVEVVNKAVDITIAAQSEYTIAKQVTAETGAFATYYLAKDNVQVGEKINIPKDFLVKSGSVQTCSTADVPVEGYEVGDKYIDFVINSKDSSATDEHMYILVSDLIDTYTAGTGITISNNVVAVDSSVVALQTDIPDVSAFITKDVDDLTNYTTTEDLEDLLDGKVDANTAITGATKCKITYDAKGLVTAGADLAESDIPSLAASKINLMTGYAKASSSAAVAETDTLNQAVGKLEKTLDGKANSATSLAGYGILDGVTYVELA